MTHERPDNEPRLIDICGLVTRIVLVIVIVVIEADKPFLDARSFEEGSTSARGFLGVPNPTWYFGNRLPAALFAKRTVFSRRRILAALWNVTVASRRIWFIVRRAWYEMEQYLFISYSYDKRMRALRTLTSTICVEKMALHNGRNLECQWLIASRLHLGRASKQIIRFRWTLPA